MYIYIYHCQIRVKFDFSPNQLHCHKIYTPLPTADFSSSKLTSITIKRKNVGNGKLLACDGKVLLSRQLEPKSKNVLLDPEQPKKKYGTEYVGGAHLVIFSLKDQQ